MRILVKLATILIVAIIVFGSCTSQKELTYLNDIDTTNIANIHPVPPPEYKIKKRDILYLKITTTDREINEILNPGSSNSVALNLSESGAFLHGYLVNEAGYINIPLIGEVLVYNYTLDEIRKRIENEARKYLKDPYINVRLLSFKFTVIGEVFSPGMYTNYNNQLTVLEAIARAGNITDFGNRGNVLVIRQSENGADTYRLNLLSKDFLSSEAYFLLPNDIVIVEPVKNKTFQLNAPIFTLFFSTALSTVSTTLLLINFFQNN